MLIYNQLQFGDLMGKVLKITCGVWLKILLLLIGDHGIVEAQNVNDWINFSQPYYKITTVKDGIYRVTYADLQSAGVPVGTVDPRRMQLFHRGVEQAIFVQGQADAVLDPTDYLEFFGKKNDGTRDAKLYSHPSLQPHSFYNIYSDTSAYFLTWNLTTPGKRTSTFSEVNVFGLPKETHHNQERLSVFTDQYAGGYTQSDFLQYTQYDQGEGWTGVALRQGQSLDYVLDLINNTVPGAGFPQFEALLVGRDNISHSVEIFVGPNSGALRSIGSLSFFGFETPKFISTLNWSDIGADGRMLVRVAALGSGTNRFQFSASYIKVNFPQNFNLAGANEKIIRLNAASDLSGKSYIELENPVSGLTVWDITDSNNISIIGTQSSGAVLSAMVPAAQIRTLYATNNTLTPSIKPITFRQINPQDFDYLIVTNRSLQKPSTGYIDVVKAYASYRASPEGGGYDTLTVAVDQLYDQFNYGEVSSLAIYEFVKFMVNGGSPRYLFFIGRGRDTFAHRGSELTSSELKDLVPTAGYPGSDMAFSAGLNGTTHEPAVATGRLNATKPEHVAAYLNKIKETEATSLSELWRKQGLHLSGGIQPFELTQFRQYMDGFKAVAEDYFLGGKIKTFGKYDPSPVQLINISEEVNKGLNIVTFFGHASSSTTDIDIGFVTDPVMGYDNLGKYPAFIVNGCNVGNFFSNQINFAEDWMLAANKGARAFMANSSFGFSSKLQLYTDLFYKVGFADSVFIKKGIGDIQKEVARQYVQLYGTDIASVTQAQQMVLLGDPAVQIFGTATADFETNDDALSLKSSDGKPVTALSEEFAIQIIVRNFGAARSDLLPIRIVRTLSDNSQITYDSLFSPVFFNDTLLFKIKKTSAAGFGNNQFKITIDPENIVKELNDKNNTGTFSAFIPLNGTKNLFPIPYGIVSASSLSLIFQATDPLSITRNFQLEIDTSASFNSSYLKKQIVSGKVLAKTAVTLLSTDSLVYYWRTKLDQPQEGESKEWATTSFMYINGSAEGWVQAKFPQLQENELDGLVADPAIAKMKYSETSALVTVKTFGSAHAAPSTATSIKINGAEYNLATQGQPCRDNTINIMAFDKTTLVPYAGIPFIFQDPRTCGRVPQVINSFTLAEVETGLSDDLLTVIDNIKVSDSVVLFSIGDPDWASWSSNLKAKLNLLGVSDATINSVQAGEPVIIFGRKGSTAGTAKVFKSQTAPVNEQALEVAETITGKYTSGTMNSVLIGPAQLWKRLIPQARMIEGTDQYDFSLYGVGLDGKEELIQSAITGSVDLSSISSSQYPYLRLKLTSTDAINLTPVQLKKWIVLFDPVAEGLLFFNGPGTQQALQEGQSWTGEYKFVNISSKVFKDSLHVNFDVLTQSQSKKESRIFKIKAPAPGDSSKFSITTNTAGKSGLNTLNVVVNPKIEAEQYYENNVVSLLEYLNVLPDRIGPVLTVTIDGRIVANGDYISPNPLILISVKDENKFLIKTDTLGMRVFLTSPCESKECPAERIFFRSPDVKWFPATTAADFRIEFRPQSLTEGNYILAVEATDASGNKSGAEPYIIEFKVKEQTTLSLQSVYPNPSADYFNFNFVLTGNVLPDDFVLIINSLDGATQQKFDLDNVSGFHIGTNTLIWKPEDTGGNSLPGGMYLYRLKMSVNGETYSNIGKLVLAR